MTGQRTTRSRARRPQERVGRNTDLLLNAGERILADGGWSELTLAGVAKEAGLSRRTLHDRFAGPTAVAAAVWASRCGPALEATLGSLVDSAGLSTGGVASEQTFTNLLAGLVVPDPRLLAGAELLVMSQFEPELRRSVSRGLGRKVTGWCEPQPGPARRADAAARAFVIAAALGLIFAGRRSGADKVDISAEASALWEAIHARPDPAPLPRTRANHLDGPPPIATGDDTRDALLQAVLESVAAIGYEATTLATVAAAAGFTQGAIFSRYPSKLALFQDATETQQRASFQANHDFMDRMAARHGRGVAEAVTIREFQRPGRQHLRAILLEQIRVMWHEPDLLAAHSADMDAAAKQPLEADPAIDARRAAGHFHFGYALGIGVPALAVLDPGCWVLPFDVVTVPLLG